MKSPSCLLQRGTSLESPRGFTLVETLVSTMIVTLVILGPLTVASNASTYARITKDTLIATYLAQEAIELLRHQQDSVYLRCVQSTTAECALVGEETPPEGAWRIFRSRLSGAVSCFSNENSTGCSYDFIDMTTNQDVAPTKYVTTQAFCNTLYVETTSNLYVCNGRASGAGYNPSIFTRSVSITAIPTISGASYHDDLRVTVTITFKRPNGYLHQVKVIDFLHARA